MKQKILSGLFFILLLTLAMYADFWWAKLDALLTGPIGQMSQPLAAVIQVVIWIIFILMPCFIGKKNKKTLPQHTSKKLQRAYRQGLAKSSQSLRLDLIAKPLKERRLQLSLSDIYRDQHVLVLEKQAKTNDSDREDLVLKLDDAVFSCCLLTS